MFLKTFMQDFPTSESSKKDLNPQLKQKYLDALVNQKHIRKYIDYINLTSEK